MANKNAENKSAFENGRFLKVDSVEPVFNTYFSPYERTRADGIKVWIGGEGHLFPCDYYTVCYPDEVREDGRRQVVELMNELMNMTIADNNKLFGYGLAHNILNHFSYEEIVEKLNAWKKEKETIHVRDEVRNINNETKFVVTDPPYKASNSLYYFSGIGKDGKVYKNEPVDRYKKTGLHVDDLDSYLDIHLEV